jgi:hypothetical protein
VLPEHAEQRRADLGAGRFQMPAGKISPEFAIDVQKKEHIPNDGGNAILMANLAYVANVACKTAPSFRPSLHACVRY